ncbi:MAG: LytTR family DNA-binding domain-containing protein [Prolixibacteraceae bacterium]
MKILIVEDEELAAKRLSQMIKVVLPDAEIFGPLDTISATVAHLKAESDYDLIFMDIQLADGKSFTVFEKVNILTPVIFTTAYDEYALQAFEHNSIDYLLKPVKKEQLKLSIDKLLKLKDYYGTGDASSKLYDILKNIKVPIIPSYKDRFLISRGDAMVPVRASEIACFFAEEKAVFLLTHDNKRHLIPNSIEELSEKLDPKLFFRVNRQYILSSDSIRKVYNHFNFKLKVELNADPKAEIFVSRSKTTSFKSWMNGEAY